MFTILRNWRSRWTGIGVRDAPEYAPISPEHIKQIGDFKVENAMSFANSCIAGLTKSLNATLVHKDPEYEQLENEIDQLILPYKPQANIPK